MCNSLGCFVHIHLLVSKQGVKQNSQQQAVDQSRPFPPKLNVMAHPKGVKGTLLVAISYKSQLNLCVLLFLCLLLQKMFITVILVHSAAAAKLCIVYFVSVMYASPPVVVASPKAWGYIRRHKWAL